MTILESVREILVGTSGDLLFDAELLLNINSISAILSSFGVEQFSGLEIDDSTEWPDFSSSIELGNQCKMYIVSRTRSMFDVSANSTVQQAQRETLNEILFRIRELLVLP